MQRIIPTEEEDHIAIMEYVQTNPVLNNYLIHIPNGGSRNIIEAAKLKRMGVRKGVSDFFLAYSINGYHGMWLELKREGLKMNSCTIEQKQWLNKMKDQGYHAYVAFGYQHAIDAFLKYIYGKIHMINKEEKE